VIINLIRESPTTLHAEAAGVPAHRVGVQSEAAFADAEREVRRRVLRSLADRESPPTAVVFVRTWEQHGDLSDGDCRPVTVRGAAGSCQHVAHPAQLLAIEAFAAEQQKEPEVPVRADAPARRGRRART
jgi:hypothetical protein